MRTDGWKTDRQTDRQTDMTKLIVIFRNFVRNRVEICGVVQTETYAKQCLHIFNPNIFVYFNHN
jgi:hypothetical protein